MKKIIIDKINKLLLLYIDIMNNQDEEINNIHFLIDKYRSIKIMSMIQAEDINETQFRLKKIYKIIFNNTDLLGPIYFKRFVFESIDNKIVQLNNENNNYIKCLDFIRVTPYDFYIKLLNKLILYKINKTWEFNIQ